jgi:hypothetical protein
LAGPIWLQLKKYELPQALLTVCEINGRLIVIKIWTP